MSIPNNLPRIPTLLGAQILQSSLQRTNRDLLQLQVQLASAKAVNRPSDDTVAAGLITVLDDVIEGRRQRLRNLEHAQAILNTQDAAVGDANDLLLDAKSVALSQIGVGSDAATRESQAVIIDAILAQMTGIANRSYLDVHFFGGDATAAPPMSELLGGVRYGGRGSGLQADLGLAPTVRLTTSGESVFGALSTRVSGERDLDPLALSATRLADLGGAVGLGVRPGAVNVNVNGTDYALDLSGAATVGDVALALQDLLDASVPGALAAGGVTLDAATGNRFNVDLNAGFTVTITDVGSEGAAADLGLAGVSFEDGVNEVGGDFDPRLTPLTPLSSLSGVTVPLGTIRIGNGGQVRDLDLSGAVTVQDLVNAVHGLNLGVRVEIAATGDRLDFVNELSGGLMSIGEVGGGATATELGVRSLAATTLLDDFNQGRGVEILSGAVDPVSGLPDPAKDLDFRVTVKDGRSFDVDLAGATTVQDVLDAVNAAAGAAGLLPGEFQAGLASDGNGLALTDATAGATTSVTALNGSHAAEHLGILGSTGSATLIGQDRATVAVDGVFAHLMALRDALRGNDEAGITIAAEKLEGDLDRLSRARAETGARSRRVADAIGHEEDLTIQDTALRSEVQDLDFTEAAIRFAALQRQMQAVLATAGQTSSLSLLDFLR
jgi:flagellin-like hook-associated protein FlgL